MIVIERNGKQVVLTGWRAWLAGAAALVVVSIIFALLAVFLLGFALTIGTIILIMIPAVVIVALLGALFGK